MRHARYTYDECSLEASIVSVEGEPDQYLLAIHDPHEPAVHVCVFPKEIRDAVIAGWTGGIAVAQSLPKMDVPRQAT